MHNENIFLKKPKCILAEEFSLSAVSNIRSSMWYKEKNQTKMDIVKEYINLSVKIKKKKKEKINEENK